MASNRPRRLRKPPAAAPAALPSPSAIDALYGLEPVFEPEQGPRGAAASDSGTAFVPVQCPYCGEHFETLADFSAGAASYIEDCQVCCQPMELLLEVDAAGALASLTARRTD
jgi:hypothetical protein